MQRISKNVFSIALALCFLFAPSLSLAKASALEVHADGAGGSVAAEVVLDGSMTASGVQFALAYDNSRLQLSGCQYGDLTGSYTVNDTEPGTIRFVWYSTDGVPVSGESTLLKLSFTPLLDGDTSIRFDPAVMAAMVVDSSLSTVDAKTSDATITIGGAGTSIVSATSAPSSTAEPYLPASTPLPQLTPVAVAVTPTPLPSAKISALSPSPSPQAEVAAPVKTPSHSAAPSSNSPTAAVMAQTNAPAPADIADSAAQQPSAIQPVFANPAAESAPAPQIEVLDTQKNTPSPWPWAIGGAALLLGLGYLLFRRFRKSA